MKEASQGLAACLMLAVVACGGSTGSRGQPEAGGGGAGGGEAGPIGAGSVAGGVPHGLTGQAGAPGGLAGQAGAPIDTGHSGQPGEVDGPSTSIECCAGATCDWHPTCEQTGSGRWQCACGTTGSERTFQTDEATGRDACSLAEGICSLAELSVGEAQCTEVTESSTDLDCAAQTRCEQRIATPFAPDANAWLVRDVVASCVRLLEGEAHDCTCAGDAQRYRVSALGVSRACGPFLDFCLASPRPTIDGPTTCSTIDAAMTEIFCRSLESCGPTLALTPDVGIVESPAEHEWGCIPGSIAPDCSCDTADASLTFEAPGVGSLPTAELCETAARLCRGDAEPTPTGHPECQPSNVSTTANVCTADAQCMVPATLNGLDVSVDGKLAVECERLGADDPWLCGCASNNDTGQFELGSIGASATDACAAAMPRCVELVGVSVEPYNRNSMASPDPGL